MNAHLIYQTLCDISGKKSCVLATVTGVQGSAPQVPGSSAVIESSGLLCGTVGGGLTEYQVMKQAQIALETGRSQIVDFDLSGILNQGSEVVCGGRMTILIDASPCNNLEAFRKLTESIGKNIPGILCTFVEHKGPDHVNISRFWYESDDHGCLPDKIWKLAGTEISGMIRTLSPGDFRVIAGKTDSASDEEIIYLEMVVPPPSLVIAGAGHVGKAVARLGKFLGFEVSVWDDRAEYACKTNIPEADNLFNNPVEENLGRIPVSNNSYLVIVTRGHLHDAEVLRIWIKTSPAYLGMMGSRMKIAQIKQQFLENGWATPEEWDRVHTPIGLKIGAKTVEEIAVSIMSEIIAVKNNK